MQGRHADVHYATSGCSHSREGETMLYHWRRHTSTSTSSSSMEEGKHQNNVRVLPCPVPHAYDTDVTLYTSEYDACAGEASFLSDVEGYYNILCLTSSILPYDNTLELLGGCIQKFPD
jgi:hypothetical protein